MIPGLILFIDIIMMMIKNATPLNESVIYVDPLALSEMYIACVISLTNVPREVREHPFIVVIGRHNEQTTYIV